MSPTRYRLVVKGELGARYASAFEEMTISAHDGITEITGEIIDPSHLQGLLERIAGLGLTLHSVTPLDDRERRGGRRHPRSDQIRPTMTERPEPSQPDRRYFSVADDDDWAANAHTTSRCWRTPSRHSFEGTVNP